MFAPRGSPRVSPVSSLLLRGKRAGLVPGAAQPAHVCPCTGKYPACTHTHTCRPGEDEPISWSRLPPGSGTIVSRYSPCK